MFLMNTAANSKNKTRNHLQDQYGYISSLKKSTKTGSQEIINPSFNTSNFKERSRGLQVFKP